MVKDQIGPALIQIERSFKEAPRRFSNAMAGCKGRYANKALDQIKRIPGPPVHPIRWTSDRQRAAFFASKGFGRGIPTRRTNTIIEAWDVRFLPTRDGGILLMSNPYEEAQYLFGPNTQGFHLDTGYVQLDDVTKDFFAEAEGGAVEVFYAECDPLEVLA